LHSAMQLSPQDSFLLQAKIKDSPWTLIDTKGSKKETEPAKVSQKDATGFVAACKTQALQSLSNPVKRSKASQPPAGSKSFCGFPWDPVDCSCVYNSLLTILLSVYMECQPVWDRDVYNTSELL
ncbi:hypothetical protein OH76DRAFT_1366382, partial [Lentinus brumalis]